MVGNAIHCSNASEAFVICLSGSVSELHRRVRIAICLPFGSMQISSRSSVICPAFRDASNDRTDGAMLRPVHDAMKWQIRMLDVPSRSCTAAIKTSVQLTNLHACALRDNAMSTTAKVLNIV